MILLAGKIPSLSVGKTRVKQTGRVEVPQDKDLVSGIFNLILSGQAANGKEGIGTEGHSRGVKASQNSLSKAHPGCIWGWGTSHLPQLQIQIC